MSRSGGLDLSRLRVLILTVSKKTSRQSRKSQQFEKGHLDSQEIHNSLKITSQQASREPMPYSLNFLHGLNPESLS
jgi:hypothetical protein